MDNRRNFYRILRVQPDASREVIQQSYRSLMQKLRMHPDLGGEHWDAGIINQAYTTLRDVKKRAAYDIALLGRYSIKTLSSGGVIGDNPQSIGGAVPTQQDGNYRNYYRLLQIQPDAEYEVIKASYHTLLKGSAAADRPLMEEAFSVLSDTRLRAQYDALLNTHVHAASVNKLRSAYGVEDNPVGMPATELGLHGSTGTPEVVQKANAQAAYCPLIRHYCRFCKTPYSDSALMESSLFCGECDSPLSLPAARFVSAPRRSLVRMQQVNSARVYVYWPGAPIRGVLGDLSPTGLSVSMPTPLDAGQVVKVNAAHFKAVAEVVYCQYSRGVSIVGAKFLAVAFKQQSGGFVSLSA